MKTEPHSPEQAEWLQHYEAALAESPAVVGFVVFDEKGGILSEKTRDLAEGIHIEDASTWVQNAYHAIDAYYPESREVFLRFRDFNVILCRAHELVALAVLDPSYELKAFDDLLSGERLKRLASRLRSAAPAGAPAAPVKRSETVFLKISDDAPAAAATAPQPAAPPAAKPNRTGIIMAASMVALLAIGGAVYFAVGQGERAAPTPPAPAPVEKAAPAAPEPVDYQTEAAKMRDEVNALNQILRELPPARAETGARAAKAFAAASAAESAFANGEYEVALQRWTEARDVYGPLALEAAEARLNEARGTLKLEHPENYVPQVWGEIQQDLNAALQARDEQHYLEAVQLTRSATERMERLPEQMRREIVTLARNAAAAHEASTAEIFYRDLLRVEPDSTEANAYLYRYVSKPGAMIQNSIDMRLALIPAGSFTMGSPEAEARRDADEIVHEVTLTEPFFMGATEVTQAQWRKVMGEPLAAEAEEGFIGPDLPVHSVSWEQAQAFAERLSQLEGQRYRLPTEAEWEYAARAGTNTAFATGAALNGTQAQVYDPDRNPASSPVPVASFAPNAWGLYDLHGNVWEWTADWFGPYAADTVENPTGVTPDSFSRVDLALKALRGGSWYDEADKARSANRWGSSPSAGANYIGFRVVREVAPYAPDAD